MKRNRTPLRAARWRATQALVDGIAASRLTQQTLGRHASIHPAQLSRILRGQRFSDRVRLRVAVLAELVGLSPDAAIEEPGFPRVECHGRPCAACRGDVPL